MKNLMRSFGEKNTRFLLLEAAEFLNEVDICVERKLALKNLWSEVVGGVEKKMKNQVLIERLFDHPHVVPPRTTKRDRFLQDEWQKRFSDSNGPHYAGLVRGWERMKNSKLPDGRTHLQMVYDECKRAGVPFELVFQAIHESLWNNEAGSGAGARGPWQFIASTGRSCGLKINATVDERKDWQKSTRAGLKYMRKLYDLTKKWDDVLSVSDRSKISENDRWLFALWHYNRGGRVKATFLQTKGQAEKYTTYCYSDNRRYGKHESARYVNKIFATREMLENYERGTNRVQEREILEGIKKSTADKLFEEWIAKKELLTIDQNRSRLQKIRTEYQKESGKNHPAEYVQNAIVVVDEKLTLYAAVTPKKTKEARKISDESGITYYQKNKKSWVPSRRLDELEKISTQYGKDLDDGVRSDNETRQIFVTIRQEQAEVLRALVQSREFKDRNIKISVSDDGEFEVVVDRRDPATGAVYTINADIAEHIVKSGDKLNDIAIRLSGHKMVSGTVLALLKALNPELAKNNYILKQGQTIRVPGKYVEVPNRKLDALVREWYPGRTEVETATAIGYIKFLNGMRPGRDVIRPGDVILVPVICDVPTGTAPQKAGSQKTKSEKKTVAHEKMKRSVEIGRGGTLEKAIQNANWKNGRPLKTNSQVFGFAVRVERYLIQVFKSRAVQSTDRVMVGKDRYGTYARFQRGNHVSGPLRLK